MRRWPWVLLGLGSLGGLLLALSGQDDDSGDAPRPGGGWYDRDAPARIRELAAPIEDATGWLRLGDFLVVVAATESGGNQYACYGIRGATIADYCPGNNARGWFGGRPKSMYAHGYKSLVQSDPDLIRRNERWAVATYAWFAYRLRNYWHQSRPVNWLAIRRGGASTRLVNDVNEIAEWPNKAPGERSADVRRRMERGCAMAGLPDSFMYERAFAPGFSWPGFEGILEILDARLPEAEA